MKRLALMLALVCSSAFADGPDAGVPPPVLLASGRVVSVDGGVIDVEFNGAYLPPATLIAEGKAFADQSAQVVELKAGIRALPMPVVVGGAATLGAVLSIVAAVVLHFLPPAPARQ